MALGHLQQHHPATNWNTYLFHFSDGDNLPSDSATCTELVEALLTHCTMVGYGEIRYGDDASFYGWARTEPSAPSSLQHALQQVTHPRFFSVTLAQKDDLYHVLHTFLQPREHPHV